jgi:hypothetical protein
LIVLLASGVAQAGTVYTSAAAWNAAVTGVTTINFEGLAPDHDYVEYGQGVGAGVTVSNVNFAVGPTGSPDIFFLLGDGEYSYPMSVISVQPQTGGADLLITLPSAVTALGFDFDSLFVGDTATITLSDGSVQTVAAPRDPDFVFFGVTAPGGITSVDITLPTSTDVPSVLGLDMRDFSYGTADTGTVPEPSSLLLFGAGLAGVAGMLRRRRRTS